MTLAHNAPAMPALRGLMVCLAASLLFACDDPGKSAGDASTSPPPAVLVAPAVSEAVSASQDFLGQTEAFQKVDLRARVTGFLDKVNFVEGGEIKKGDVLYLIDPAQFNAERDAAAAQVDRADATLAEAEAQLARYKTLTERGTTSQAQLDEATAKAGQARADVAAAKAELENAKLNVTYTEITAPVAGRIGRTAVDVGNLVSPDTGVLATIVALDPIRVIFSASEREYLNYRKAMAEGKAQDFKPRLKLANGEIYPHEGKVEFVDVQVDTSTGTIALRASFPNPQRLLLPGEFVTVSLVGSEPSEEIVIPQAAVQQDQTGYFVLVVDGDNTAQRRSIKTGQRLATKIVVLDGLTAGEQVIVDGIQKVRPGAVVTPSQQTTPQSAS